MKPALAPGAKTAVFAETVSSPGVAPAAGLTLSQFPVEVAVAVKSAGALLEVIVMF